MTTRDLDITGSDSTPDRPAGRPSLAPSSKGPSAPASTTPMLSPASARDATPWIPTTEAPLEPAPCDRDEVSE